MDVYTTPAAKVMASPETPPPLTEAATEVVKEAVTEVVKEAVTEVVTKGTNTDDGDFAALIGGLIGAVLFLLICVTAVLLWCLSRHKGSYVTNEMDDDSDDIDDDDDGSVGSDTALQSREPLKSKEEE